MIKDDAYYIKLAIETCGAAVRINYDAALVEIGKHIEKSNMQTESLQEGE